MSDPAKDPALTSDILAAIERHGGWRNMLNKLEAAQVVLPAEQASALANNIELFLDGSEAEQVCAEAYQVVGSLLSDLGQFNTEQGRKILDNLSEHRMIHADVLPWPSFEAAQVVDDAMLDRFIRKYYARGMTVDIDRLRAALTAALAAKG
jgi:hypothetical protein